MAAGLPVIVSDWNGYRQTVRDGEDGIAVPSWLPPAGAGLDIARAYHQGIENYDQYIGYTSQFTAIDIAATRAALEALAGDNGLRARMGESGRKRALETFDWKVVVGQYEDLWAELAARRAKDAESAPRAEGASAAPLHDDPFRVFAHYPAATLGPDTMVSLAPGTDGDRFRRHVAAPMNAEAGRYLPAEKHFSAVLARLGAEGTLRAADLAADLTREGENPVNYFRAIGWLAKIGIVELEE
jgi:hypothetical protein